jgi:hypothetical protein
VLEALAELEFGSLDRRAGRVRGQADGGTELSRTDVEGESALLFESEGGPDAAAAVVRHLDVESFARHSRVQYYIDFFRGEARDRFTIWLGRLPRYEGMIREQLRRYGVPEDLVYLAMIESGYSNTAVSRARAVGMWQFIASTGRQYGLSQDVWEDQRRDPFRATEAAARHRRSERGVRVLVPRRGRLQRRCRAGLRVGERLPTSDGEAATPLFELSDRATSGSRPATTPKLIAA